VPSTAMLRSDLSMRLPTIYQTRALGKSEENNMKPNHRVGTLLITLGVSCQYAERFGKS
jgi:hypothetical protein